MRPSQLASPLRTKRTQRTVALTVIAAMGITAGGCATLQDWFGTPLVMSTLPAGEPEAQLRDFTTLGQVLTASIGRQVRFKPASSYQEAVRRLKQGEVDVALIGPASYLEVRAAGGLKVVAKAQRDGLDIYRGVIVVRERDSIRGLQALKGKTVALVDTLSTTGYKLPLRLLAAMGLEPGRDFKVLLTGSHYEAARAVATGKAVAGACFEQAIDMQEDPDALYVLRYTEPVPGDPVVVRSGLPSGVQKRLTNAVLNLDAEPAGAQFLETVKIDQFVPATDAEYDHLAPLLTPPAP